METAVYYPLFAGVVALVLKTVNEQVTEPYMDEPFHVPQVQAYCRKEWSTWDPKITTPPGLYVLSVGLKYIFLLKCNLPMLRLIPALTLVCLPIVMTRLIRFHQRLPAPTSLLAPDVEAFILSMFPVAFFFGFLYYTEVPSLLFVVATLAAATQGRHALAAMLGLVSCTFRQTNIVWMLYAFAASQLMYLRFRPSPPNGTPLPSLHDPMALAASPIDLLKAVASLPRVLPDILSAFQPYIPVVGAFVAFVVWNGGIVLGDKSNHVPTLHIPQVYYFIGFSTVLGWPVLVSSEGGPRRIVREVSKRMFGSGRNTMVTCVVCALMGVTIHFFTIHHPFLLSDNRHYTFYVWQRVFRFHWIVPYLFAPGYLACAWVWYVRVATDQTLLQTLVLPACLLPTLLPTPLLEPRYFMIPYIFLRAQVVDVPAWGLALEGLWYAAINAATMYVFLYKEREGVGRFMW